MLLVDHPIKLDLGDCGEQEGAVTVELTGGDEETFERISIKQVVWFKPELKGRSQRTDITLACDLSLKSSFASYIEEEIREYLSKIESA